MILKLFTLIILPVIFKTLSAQENDIFAPEYIKTQVIRLTGCLNELS